jgi:hypothetical protein
MAKTSTRKRYGDKVTLYEYLVCDGARSGMGCPYRSVPYHVVESTALQTIQDAHFYATIASKDGPKEIQKRLDSLQGEKALNEKQILKLTDLILKDDAPSQALVAKLKEIEARQVRVARDIQVAEAQVYAIQEQEVSVDEFDKLQREASPLLRGPEGRLRTREYIRKVIDRIVLDTSADVVNYQIHYKSGNVSSVVFWTERDQSNVGVVCFQLFRGVVKLPDFTDGVAFMVQGVPRAAVDRVTKRMAAKVIAARDAAGL